MSLASRLEDIRSGLRGSQDLFGSILNRSKELRALPETAVERLGHVLQSGDRPPLLLVGSLNEVAAQAEALDTLRERCDGLCSASKDLRLQLSIATHRLVSPKWQPGPRDARSVYNARMGRRKVETSPPFLALLASALTEQIGETSTNLAGIQSQLRAYIPGTAPKGDDFRFDPLGTDSEPILFRPKRR